MAHTPSGLRIAQREAAWRDAMNDAEAEARRRFEHVGRRLGLRTEDVRLLAYAGLAIARQFAAEATYANYQHRTGQPWPEEWRLLDDDERATAWRLALQSLEAAAR